MMSSAISTEPARANPARRADDSLQPWQFFVLAALACATAVTFVIRGQGLTPVLLLTVMMAAIAFVGLTVLRTVRPLTTSEEDRTAMIGARTRAALEREKLLTLRAIKELEFDRAMGKLSDEDFREMSGRLRARAARLIRQLDAGSGYREQVERDLTKRLGGLAPVAPQPPAEGHSSASSSNAPNAGSTLVRLCSACSTQNDPDARFCKECGHKL